MRMMRLYEREGKAVLATPHFVEHWEGYKERVQLLADSCQERVKLSEEQRLENEKLGFKKHVPAVPADLQAQLDELDADLHTQFKAKFEAAPEIRLYVRPAIYFKWRDVGFDGVGNGISLKWFCIAIGITPEQLAPIFGHTDTPEVEEGSEPDDYDRLDRFTMGESEKYLMLMKLFGKPLNVRRYSGATGETWHLFTVNLDGTLTEAKEAA